MASAMRRIESRSAVTSPTMRMARLGPGKGWRQTIASGTELETHLADLVLEQHAQGLDQLELQVVGQPTDLVMGLDVGGAVPPPDYTRSGYSVPWTSHSTG
jgi:hypothetical protein